MACDTKSRIVKLLKQEIKGKATSYKEEKEGVFIPFNPNSEYIKTLQQAIEIAKAKVLKINSKYNIWSNGDVLSTDTSTKDGVYINIQPTQALIDTYEADEQRKEVDQQEALDLYKKSLEISEEEAKKRIKDCE